MTRTDPEDAERPSVVVLDMGKTNIKLSVVSADGVVHEAVSRPNRVKSGHLWQHHDLSELSAWIFENLAAVAQRHPISSVVSSGHGSGGMLVGSDPDDGDGTVLPMIDYEQALPEGVRTGYAPQSGSFFDRGSTIMQGSTHQARQLYWMQQTDPAAVARASWFLGVPQYWAWRLSGVATCEASYLSAQSHLWNVVERTWTPIVRAHGWERLMPPFAKAWDAVGVIRPSLADRHGLPQGIKVFVGGHDSTLNYYRYQAAGFVDFTLVSTGTWIVGFSDNTSLAALDEERGMTCNSDVFGEPLGGVLTMGGREFAHILGSECPDGNANLDVVMRLVGRGTMALPSFGTGDGLFPGSAGRGCIVGPLPQDGDERRALAILYCALLTVECVKVLGRNKQLVLDGSFLRDPLYPALVAAMLPDRQTFFNLDTTGVTSGAALLTGHRDRRSKVPIRLATPNDLGAFAPALLAYAEKWRSRAHAALAST